MGIERAFREQIVRGDFHEHHTSLPWRARCLNPEFMDILDL
jgi:hypothetical protein